MSTPILPKTLKRNSSAIVNNITPAKRHQSSLTSSSSASSSSSSGVYCSVFNCSNRQNKYFPGVRFHQFPKNPHICKQWVINSRNASLDNLPIHNLHSKHRVICSKHFSDQMYINPTRRHERSVRLKDDAIPTINIHNPPSCFISTTTTMEREPVACHIVEPTISHPISNPIYRKDDSSQTVLDLGKLQETLAKLKSDNSKLRRENKNLKNLVRYYKKRTSKLHILSRKYSILRANRVHHSHQQQQHHPSPFIQNQLFSSCKNSRGYKWDPIEKTTAINLYYRMIRMFIYY